MKIKELMSSKIVSIKPNATITDASKLMKANRISCLPIMENNEVLGIITTTDLVNIYTSTENRHMDPWDEVSKFMSSPVTTLNQDESVKKASKLMSEKKFHHIIVNDDDGNMVGILSSIDIARAID